jgi:hypothetical protein
MTTTDRTTEPAGVFDAHLARWEAAEADPDGTLSRVARAMWIAEGRHPDDWGNTSLTAFLAKQDHLRYLAATAIDALRPAPDAPRDARLTAVLDLADELEAEAQRQVDVYPPDSDALPAVVGRSWVNAARQFRAAVAAPLAGHDNEAAGGEGE